MNLVLLEDVVVGRVLKRPSLTCKSPYVADVVLEDGTQIMAHSPSLGCRGLADKEAMIVLTKKKESKTTKCSHTVQLSVCVENENTCVVGINPRLGEIIAEKALVMNCIKGLQNIRTYTRETTVLNSRFDFTGIDETGTPFIMEVKNVPLADYIDVPDKERKKYKHIIDSAEYGDKISYFPDGYRKSVKDVVSPRALKHIEELTYISQTSITRAIMCYIVEREDANRFQPSNIDPTYKSAVQKAWLNGVEIKTVQVSWNKKGECTFITNDLPIHLFELYGPYSLE
jgi:DNA-binding sugar fermentation-stimulating protein